MHRLASMTALIASCNVSSLSCRLATVVGQLVDSKAEVLIAQETRITRMALPAAKAAAERWGFQLFHSAHAVDRTGRAMGGVAALASKRCKQLTLPEGLDPQRHVLIGLERAGESVLERSQRQGQDAS